ARAAEGRPARRPAHAGDGPRAARLAEAAGEGREVRGDRRGRGGETGARREEAGRQDVRERLVLRTDGVRRYGSVHADRPRGGLRPGGQRPEILRRRRSDRGGERRRLRPILVRLDEARAARASRRERAPIRGRRDQRPPPDRERDDPRWVQTERLREGAQRL